jgi:hypothetical protein
MQALHPLPPKKRPELRITTVSMKGTAKRKKRAAKRPLPWCGNRHEQSADTELLPVRKRFAVQEPQYSTNGAVVALRKLRGHLGQLSGGMAGLV